MSVDRKVLRMKDSFFISTLQQNSYEPICV